jgi:hypothetical protein
MRESELIGEEIGNGDSAWDGKASPSAPTSNWPGMASCEPSALATSASAPGSPSSGGEVPSDPSGPSTALAPAALLSVASGLAMDAAGWEHARAG